MEETRAMPAWCCFSGNVWFVFNKKPWLCSLYGTGLEERQNFEPVCDVWSIERHLSRGFVIWYKLQNDTSIDASVPSVPSLVVGLSNWVKRHFFQGSGETRPILTAQRSDIRLIFWLELWVGQRQAIYLPITTGNEGMLGSNTQDELALDQHKPTA